MGKNDRLEKLDAVHVGHGFVVRVGAAYEKYRQRAVSAHYRVWGKSMFPERTRNWVHFRRAAALIRMLDADIDSFMAAQFLTATPTSYPYPSNLYSKRAIEAYRATVSTVGVQQVLQILESHLENYERRFKLPKSEIVYQTHLGFPSWFRVLYMDLSDIPLAYAREALDEFRDSEIRKAVVDAGYDIVKVEAACQRRADQG